MNWISWVLFFAGAYFLFLCFLQASNAISVVLFKIIPLLLALFCFGAILEMAFGLKPWN